MKEISLGESYDKERPKISVVFSFFNEQKVLPTLIARTRKALEGAVRSEEIKGYELVFVNDCSTDGSKDIILEAARDREDIVLVNMARRFGVSECVLAGFQMADGDAVVYLDADLQDPPELIPDLIRAWKTNDVEVVYTTRNKREGEHPLKLLLTKMGYRLIGRMAEVELPVDSGDYKLLSRRALGHILAMAREKKPYLRGMASWIGFRQQQILYERAPRYDGRENTKFPVLSVRTIYGYLDRALIAYSDLPLKATLVVGMLVSVVSLCYIGIVVIQKIIGAYVPGWPALMAAILLLGGLQLFVIGIIGLYINVIYLQSKQRPNYIVESIVLPNDREINHAS